MLLSHGWQDQRDLRAELKRTKAEKEEEKKERKGKGKGKGRKSKAKKDAKQEAVEANTAEVEATENNTHEEGFSMSSVEERLKNERQEISDEDEAGGKKRCRTVAREEEPTGEGDGGRSLCHCFGSQVRWAGEKEERGRQTEAPRYMVLDNWMKKGSVWSWEGADADIIMRLKANIIANGGFAVAAEARREAKTTKPEDPSAASQSAAGGGLKRKKSSEEVRDVIVCFCSSFLFIFYSRMLSGHFRTILGG